MLLLFVGLAGKLWRGEEVTVETVFNDKTSFSIGDQPGPHFKPPHTGFGIEVEPKYSNYLTILLCQQLIF